MKCAYLTLFSVFCLCNLNISAHFLFYCTSLMYVCVILYFYTVYVLCFSKFNVHFLCCLWYGLCVCLRYCKWKVINSSNLLQCIFSEEISVYCACVCYCLLLVGSIESLQQHNALHCTVSKYQPAAGLEAWWKFSSINTYILWNGFVTPWLSTTFTPNSNLGKKTTSRQGHACHARVSGSGAAAR